MEYDLCLEPDLLELEGIEQELVIEPMSFEEKLIYFSLFTVAKPIDKYGVENLPPRVYELWDKITRNNLIPEKFCCYFVLDSQTVHDPILIAKQNEYCYSSSCFYDSECYMIGRWGKALIPFKELRFRAVRRIAMKLKEHSQKKVRELIRYVKEPDYYVEYLLEYGLLDGLSTSDIIKD